MELINDTGHASEGRESSGDDREECRFVITRVQECIPVPKRGKRGLDAVLVAI